MVELYVCNCNLYELISDDKWKNKWNSLWKTTWKPSPNLIELVKSVVDGVVDIRSKKVTLVQDDPTIE